jgi:peptidoglycan L-alanyl-D-glutamate endopeptidase CwlK
VVNKSKHQLGHAVDCCFLKDGVPSWDPSHPWALYGAMAQALGLIWGGAWINFKDRTHVEVR